MSSGRPTSSIIDTLASTVDAATKTIAASTSALTTQITKATASAIPTPAGGASATNATTADACRTTQQQKTTSPATNKKSGSRPSTKHSANITASISLKDETKKTFIPPSSLEQYSSYIRNKVTRYNDEGIDIYANLASLHAAQKTLDACKKKLNFDSAIKVDAYDIADLLNLDLDDSEANILNWFRRYGIDSKTNEIDINSLIAKLTLDKTTPKEMANRLSISLKPNATFKDGKPPTDKELTEEGIQKALIIALSEAINLRKVELVQERIIEHAARRADLFFYLLVAVYKTNATLSWNGGATITHGSGSAKHGTAGCHSFPFANIKVTPGSTHYSDILASLFPNGTLPLDETYLLKVALNSTVELPTIINDYDGHLEGKRQRTWTIECCFKVLNKVAAGEMTPIEGMNEFYNIMAKFFGYFELSHLATSKRTIDNYRAFNKITEYQQLGTFLGRDSKTHKISTDYLNMMLNINSWEKHAPIPYAYYISKLQKEILSQKADATPKESAASKPR